MKRDAVMTFPSLLALAIVAAVSTTATAQGARTSVVHARRLGCVITGTVVDSLTGLALRGVTVTVAGPSNFSRTRTTDLSGRFRFDSLAPGSYVASTAHRLLDTMRVTIRVQAGDSVTAIIATRGRVAPPLLSAGRQAQLVSLDSARARWRRQRPMAYRFRVRTECFCFGPALVPLVEVSGGVVTTVGTDGVRHLVTPDSSKIYDIAGLFDYMMKAARDERVTLRAVEYDSQFGYPAKFTIDSHAGAGDSWGHFSIENFEVITPRSP